MKKSISGLKFKPFPLSRDDFPEINHTKKIERPKCRWCQGDCRALTNNGIIGPGYAEGNYVCNDCGRVQ